MVTHIVASESFVRGLIKRSTDSADLDFSRKAHRAVAFAALRDLNRSAFLAFTLGESGAYFVEASDASEFHVPALQSVTVDTTGAGDIFHGALAFGLRNGMPAERCMEIATVAAGMSVTKIGGRTSIPDWIDVQAKYEQGLVHCRKA
jgi:sugar/nucleoside kinase (ribokinase family)